MEILHIETSVLDRLKKVLHIATDIELAKALGIKRGTISSWRHRGTLDYSLIIDFCKKNNISLDWLFFGKGSMYIQDRKEEERPVATQNGQPIPTIHHVGGEVTIKISDKEVDLTSEEKILLKQILKSLIQIIKND